MSHAPMLADTNNPLGEAYSAVLARDVTSFMIQFWDRQQQMYVDEWLYTNQLPQKVAISIATGKKVSGKMTSEDLVVREVTVASLGVPPQLQGAGGARGPGGTQGQQPNFQQPNPNLPPGQDPRGPRGGRDPGRQGGGRGPNSFPNPGGGR